MLAVWPATPLTATWRSGYAAVCKTVYPGSIPGVASTFKIKKHDRFGTMGDAQWRRGENHRTVTLAG